MLKTLARKITDRRRTKAPVVIKRPCLRCFKQHTTKTAFCGCVCRWLWLRRDASSPSHKRFLKADTARLLYKNRLQEVSKHLALQAQIAHSTADKLQGIVVSIDECISVAKRLEEATAHLQSNQEAADAKQG